MTEPRDSRPVFLDPSGRRRRGLRWTVIALGVAATVLFLFIASGVIIAPVLPRLALTQTAADSLGRAPRLPARKPARPISPRAERERLASRKRLFEQLRDRPSTPSLRYAEMPIARPHQRPDRLLAARPVGDPIVAGFYVNWDDNSLVSLRQHIDALDWVVAEWGFVTKAHGDTLPLTWNVDRRVLALAARSRRPPQIFALVTNATQAAFDPGAVAALLSHPLQRAAAIDSMVAVVERYDLAGITIDFEDLPATIHPQLLGFLQQLATRLHAGGRLLTQALPVNDPEWPLARYAQVNDRVFLMVYDEHDPSDPPGPIASQHWFDERLRALRRLVPPAKAIVGVGAYGYDWSDATEEAGQLTFQETMTLVRDHGLHPGMDRGALNPTFAFDDPDSTSHIVWYLDAPTAYNQMRRALAAGSSGVGVWRLGSEDPSLWSVLGRGGLTPTPAALDTIRIGYDVEFIGSGEILRMVAEPTLGRRALTIDASGTVTGETVLQTPSSYVIRRYGRRKDAVALTFDDGPDGDYTPAILDTLRQRGVKATFFVIGENAEIRPGLLQRIVREGHEVGNHTFSHPNLALVSAQATRLELNATERLIEAVLNRRTALFRPPYFGDAEPTTSDELVPIAVAQGLGYITVGLRVDPGDWETPPADTIIRRTLDQLSEGRGNVVLLHDGGGDRSNTVAALGPLIDSIRARGLQITTVTDLAHVPTALAMAPLPPSTALRRFLELTSFSLVGWFELALHAVFLVAMVLGVSRLGIILGLALWQRFAPRFGRRAADVAYHPRVSVVVPAYQEELVVVRTVESLLAQQYDGLEVVVVDDGSPDRTYDVLEAAFGTHPQVRVLRKPNGGKASALNLGLEYAAGDVIVALDADTLFPPGTIAALIRPLADARVGAVAGNAKVGNRVNLVTRWQAIEYVTSQNIDRRAFAMLNCITVVPGAIGAWRRDLVVEAGGFRDDTLAEDQDLTMTLLKRGWRIAYADRAVAYTEAPDSLGALSRQRFRWSFGTLQCAWKHRDALFRPRYGTLGFIGLPNIWIFQLLFPFISPVADLLFVWSLVTVWLNKVEHGAEYARQSLVQVLTFYVAFLLVDWLAAVVALTMERGEEKWLAWLVLIQRFAYRQVMYWVVVKAAVWAVQGRARGWGKLERKGTVELSPS